MQRPSEVNTAAKNYRWYGVFSRLLGGLLMLSAGFASAETYSSNPHKALEEKIATALSGPTGQTIEVRDIDKTPVPGLVQVTLENGLILYASADGEHFIVGDLYEIGKTGITNLAEKQREAGRLSLIDNIDVAQMIVFSPEGDTRDHITVFTDVTCFYCQKLHQEVEDLNRRGIEVRYLAYPRGGMQSEGARKLATAWCADDKQTTLTKLKAGVDLPINECSSSPVAEQFALGGKLGVRGTPAIITSSGEMIPGYKSAADLAKMLELN